MSTVSFPAPVGGTPYELDFAPSVLFAVLYFLMIPLVAYRMFHPRSKCYVVIGTGVFTVERVITYALRASMARSPTRRVLGGLVTYSQVTYGAGYIGIAADLVQLTRCLLINATYGSGPIFSESPASRTEGGHTSEPPQGTPDMPFHRFLIRRFCDSWSLVYLAGWIPTVLAGLKYKDGFASQAEADHDGRVRYAGTSVVLFCNVVLFAVVLCGSRRLERTSRRGANVLYILMTLVVMDNTMRISVHNLRASAIRDALYDHLPDLARGAKLDNRAKPSFTSSTSSPNGFFPWFTFSVNVRKIVGTSSAGDHRLHDMTRMERLKEAEGTPRRRMREIGRGKDV